MQKWLKNTLLIAGLVIFVKSAFAVETVSIQYITDGLKKVIVDNNVVTSSDKINNNKIYYTVKLLTDAKQREDFVLRKVYFEKHPYTKLIFAPISFKKSINLDNIQLYKINLNKEINQYFAKDLFAHRQISIFDLVKEQDEMIKKYNLNVTSSQINNRVFISA